MIQYLISNIQTIVWFSNGTMDKICTRHNFHFNISHLYITIIFGASWSCWASAKEGGIVWWTLWKRKMASGTLSAEANPIQISRNSCRTQTPFRTTVDSRSVEAGRPPLESRTLLTRARSSWDEDDESLPVWLCDEAARVSEVHAETAAWAKRALHPSKRGDRGAEA